MTSMTYATDFTAIRGFRRNFAHLAHISNDLVRCDFVNREGDAYTISIEAVADYEADRFGALRANRYVGVPALRRSIKAKGATTRVRQFFASLPAGTSRKDAVAAAVDAGFAYCTARTQYQIWKAAN